MKTIFNLSSLSLMLFFPIFTMRLLKCMVQPEILLCDKCKNPFILLLISIAALKSSLVKFSVSKLNLGIDSFVG